MTFWLILLGLVKRRNVAVGMAVASLGLAALVIFAIPTRYVSVATVVLTTSPTNDQSLAGDPNQRPMINPLLNFNEGLKIAVTILVQSMNTPEVLDQLGLAEGSPTSVTISGDGGAEVLGDKGPFLFFTGQSTVSPDAAKDAVVRAEQLTREVLIDRQRALNAPESQLISLLFVVPPTEAVADHGVQIRGTAFGLGLGLVGSLGVAYLLAVLRENRRGRRRGGVPDESAKQLDMSADQLGAEDTVVLRPINGSIPAASALPLDDPPAATAGPAEAAPPAARPSPILRSTSTLGRYDQARPSGGSEDEDLANAESAALRLPARSLGMNNHSANGSQRPQPARVPDRPSPFPKR